MMKLATLGAIVKRRQVFLHPVRSVNFLRALMVDRRIPLPKKALFVAMSCTMLALLLFPDVISETILSMILPVLGSILGIPVDIGLDWAAFAILSVNLLRVFPADIVNEHYTAQVLNPKKIESANADGQHLLHSEQNT